MQITALELLTKLVLAVLLGGLIGYEREMHGKPAGLRTHILICLGSALFTALSMSFPGNVDPSRIAAGIVTGVGFLGAGAIFRAKDHVEGLTTAADLWVISGIGLAIGMGLYEESVIAAVFVFIVLFLKGHFYRKR